MNPATLSAALEAACARWEDRPALVYDSETMSYRQLGASVARVASAYHRMGIGPGDRVICQMRNHPEHLVASAAAWRCGAIHVGADHDLVPSELAALLGRTDAVALVVRVRDHAAYRDEIDLLRQTRPDLKIVPVAETSGEVGVQLGDEVVMKPVERADDQGSAFAALGPHPDDAAVIFFTSGTTGVPKGVVRYHRRLVEGWRWVGQMLSVTSEDVHLGHLPLSHGFGFGMGVMALLTGGKLVLLERFSPDNVLRLIAEQRVTVLHGAAAHFNLITGRLDPVRHDVASLRIGLASSASFSPELIQRIFEQLQMDLMLSYGSSEGLGWSTTDREDIVRGSVGKPPDSVVRIVGPDQEPVAAGEVGEIALRKVQPVDYWNGNAPVSANASSEWHYTGDLGRIDADGRLYVLGRLKHQVNRGGIKVDAAEVEGVLVHHPNLKDAAVVGVPDPVLGQIVCACLVVAGDPPPTLEDVRSYLAPSLSRHKLPEAIRLLSEIPRNPMGKVNHEALYALVDPDNAQAKSGGRRSLDETNSPLQAEGLS